MKIPVRRGQARGAAAPTQEDDVSEMKQPEYEDDTCDSRMRHEPDELARLRAENARLAEKVRGMVDAIEAAEAHHQWVRDGGKGQHVPFHGDFASAGPSVMNRLNWWAREFRSALAERVRKGEA
jgi:hypothetical protein